MQSTIPNVSTIYRQLSYMSRPPSQQRVSQEFDSTNPQNLYKQKQNRHNQLMQKLRNAQNQCGQLGIALTKNDVSLKSNQWYKTDDNNRQTTFEYRDYESAISATNYGQKQTETRWKPPNIKYRHIEDIKPPPMLLGKTEVQNQFIQKQFYEHQSPKIIQKPVKNQNIQEQKQINKKTQSISQASYGKTWINRQSKYQDKIESYYELIRKKPIKILQKNQVSSHLKDTQLMNSTNKNKFLRSNYGKADVLQLSKALKLLSSDE